MELDEFLFSFTKTQWKLNIVLPSLNLERILEMCFSETYSRFLCNADCHFSYFSTTVKMLCSICGEIVVVMHVIYLNIEKVHIPRSNEECEGTGLNETWMLNQNLVAVDSRPPNAAPGIDSSAPLCLPVPQLQTHKENMSLLIQSRHFVGMHSHQNVFPLMIS